jgi:hypothetical protein
VAGTAAALVHPQPLAWRSTGESRPTWTAALDVVPHELARALEQRAQGCRIERVDRCEGIEASEEQELGLPDVADPRDRGLPHDRVTERDRAERTQALHGLVEIGARVEQIRPELREHGISQQSSRAEQLQDLGPRADGDVGLGVQRQGGVSRCEGGREMDLPATGHAHVRPDHDGELLGATRVRFFGGDERGAVEQQVLAPGLHARDGATDELPLVDGRELAVAANDPLPLEHRPQLRRSAMDGVALGHRGSLSARTHCGTLTSTLPTLPFMPARMLSALD